MNWREQFDKEYERAGYQGDGGYKVITSFISTEIIEKLIEDIPNTCDKHPDCIKPVKQQLKSKWL